MGPKVLDWVEVWTLGWPWQWRDVVVDEPCFSLVCSMLGIVILLKNDVFSAQEVGHDAHRQALITTPVTVNGIELSALIDT